MNPKSTAEKFQSGYEITVIGRHFELTDAIKAYVIDKVSKIERIGERIIQAIVTLDVIKLEHSCDIQLLFGATKIKVSANTDNIYSAIDKATARLRARVLKYRSRLLEHHAREVREVEMNVDVILAPTAEEELEDINAEIESINIEAEVGLYSPHKVVAKEKQLLKTLTLKEAIMKMELAGDPLLVFRAEADQKLKVIYRREDGNYGVIEPE